jgi:hypothetical protein
MADLSIFFDKNDLRSLGVKQKFTIGIFILKN